MNRTLNPGKMIGMSFEKMKIFKQIKQINEHYLALLQYNELTFLAYVYYLQLQNDEYEEKFKNLIDYNRLRRYERLPKFVEQIESKLNCTFNLFYEIDLDLLIRYNRTNNIEPLFEHDKICYKNLGQMILVDEIFVHLKQKYLQMALVLGVDVDINKDISTKSIIRSDTQSTVTNPVLKNLNKFSNLLKSWTLWSVIGIVALLATITLIVSKYGFNNPDQQTEGLELTKVTKLFTDLLNITMLELDTNQPDSSEYKNIWIAYVVFTIILISFFLWYCLIYANNYEIKLEKARASKTLRRIRSKTRKSPKKSFN